MLMRALIVLLVVLNLGVAAWWLGREEAAPPAPVEQPMGVPRLELVPADAPVAAPTPAAAIATRASAMTCFRIGPLAERAQAERITTPLGARALRVLVSEVPGEGASGYSVLLPPQASREAAQALAKRIGDAGFSDYLVINAGADINGIALGRYRSRETALRRQSELVAGGFAAEVRAVGRQPPSQWWLQLAAPVGTQIAELSANAGAAAITPLDCDALR